MQPKYIIYCLFCIIYCLMNVLGLNLDDEKQVDCQEFMIDWRNSKTHVCQCNQNGSFIGCFLSIRTLRIDIKWNRMHNCQRLVSRTRKRRGNQMCKIVNATEWMFSRLFSINQNVPKRSEVESNVYLLASCQEFMIDWRQSNVQDWKWNQFDYFAVPFHQFDHPESI